MVFKQLATRDILPAVGTAIVDEIALVLECFIEHVETVELLVVEVFYAPLLGNIHGLFNIRLVPRPVAFRRSNTYLIEIGKCGI
ncbi:TPA: hypothetical protein JAK04_002207 [Corynebacterium striatum]|nr:hypothetical protein [Corynebacterium striatum]PXY04321.1 hypothetical protein CKF55_13790 [Corynebacterium striatum]PXY04895.1 hypothetical protein CKF55_12565 [Corynebacterium striatum]PXY06836.1 hypothetical protein CKF72_12120 [Corynebacterium striatum]PXY11208.1 hypothetical protein CKF74_12205 [Corynebacterium striatum]